MASSAHSASAINTRRTRSACDRCHSQKLRCVKKTNQQKCERCSRLQTTCEFSPRVPRSSQKAREQGGICNPELLNIRRSPIRSEAAHGWISAPFLDNSIINDQIETFTPDFRSLIEDDSFIQQNFDWSGIFSQSSDLGLINHDAFSDLASLSPVDQTASNEIHEICNTYPKVDAEDLSSIVRKTADLNVALHECFSNFPTIVDSNRQKATLLVFEEVFSLTNTFFDILRNLSFGENHNHPLYLINPSTVDLDQDRLLLPVDEGTLLLLASCHSHLINIFDSVFQRIQGCLKQSLRPHPGRDWAVVLPKLQIGTVEMPSVRIDVNTPIPPTATTAMYMFMITMFSSQLWEQLAGVVGKKTDGLNSSVTLKDMVWDTVVDRTAGMLGTINDTKLLLQQHSS